MSSCPVTISLPAHLVEQAQPFSIDFGGSVIKIAYKLVGEAENEEGQARIYLSQYPRAKLQDALVFIRDTVPLTTSGEQLELTMTGIGTFEHQATIEKVLGIKVKSEWELFCVDRMFCYLVSSLSDEQLYFPPLAVHDESTNSLLKGLKAWNNGSPTIKRFEVTPWDYSGHRNWPCLTLGLGSAFLYNVMQEDGATRQGVFDPEGGRAFHGLGSLLTGAKTFDELIALAEAGDARSVHIYGKDFPQENPRGNGEGGEKHNPAAEEFDCNRSSYGWAIGKHLADFKKEDLARALLNSVCSRIIEYSLQVANKMQVSNIVALGGFAMHPLVRSTLEREFLEAQAKEQFPLFSAGIKDTTFRTIKVGSHLGALGALFSGVELEVAMDKKE